MDHSDIDSVIASVGRAIETLESVQARLTALPQTPGWRAPTRVMVTWRLDQLSSLVAGASRDAHDTLASAHRDRQRLDAERREHTLMTGVL